MNHILIYRDEATDLVYESYLKLPHAEVHEDFIKFYTINQQEVYHVI